MSETKLIIGMPAGSLADPNRGGSLVNLLKGAGFRAKGYENGGPTTFPLSSFLMGWDGRPQEFGSQLGIGEIDIAISGRDWIRERVLEMKYEFNQDIEVKNIMSLERGHVRIVIINDDEENRPCDEWLSALLKENALVSMVSEMPYLALEWFQAKASELGFGESHSQFSVQKFRTPPKIDSGLVIYETWGKTEAKVKNRSVDFGLEITQSGSAIRNYGLNIVDEVMHSETCVFANPGIHADEEKTEIARMFLLNLYGSIFAEDKVLVSFNYPKSRVEEMVAYLQENKLFANEPTMNEGINYVEFSIQLDVGAKELTLAKVRYELAKLGATGIETIPLESSIPGIDVIDF
jgi:ATP phosphoribosyltransferase